MVDVAVVLVCGLEQGFVGPRQAKGVQPEACLREEPKGPFPGRLIKRSAALPR